MAWKALRCPQPGHIWAGRGERYFRLQGRGFGDVQVGPGGPQDGAHLGRGVFADPLLPVLLSQNPGIQPLIVGQGFHLGLDHRIQLLQDLDFPVIPAEPEDEILCRGPCHTQLEDVRGARRLFQGILQGEGGEAADDDPPFPIVVVDYSIEPALFGMGGGVIHLFQGFSLHLRHHLGEGDVGSVGTGEQGLLDRKSGRARTEPYPLLGVADMGGEPQYHRHPVCRGEGGGFEKHFVGFLGMGRFP